MSKVIQVENVSKYFRFYSDPPRSFKSVLVGALRGRVSFGQRQSFCALKDISFDIEQGEFVGIMGRNGAGKSTLLKLITGIYTPTSGKVTVNGLIAPLIEVGAGFSPDLTGEENILLNAAILGFGRRSAYENFKKILDFSELGDFIHMPVRTYSSGMAVRLGFSIAIHLDAPILLLDEVLSVGDAGFQAKCLEKIQELHKLGRTMVFITHDPNAIKEHCSRCIVIDQHQKVYDGAPEQAVELYQSLVLPHASH